MTKFIALAIGLGALAQAAVAQSATEIDANGDGLMTLEEVQAVFPDVTADAFSQADANGDGALDDSEMAAGQEQGLIPASTDG
ncbi:EF-hand domain-containing protein [Roseovarius spongiae]|uniref:EF-hand domain-containing protein n=1 Tax=Roseovarius spongiae TaxID=2320272 RepID=A0A3A8AX52_9RHOB|nr:EF-hand domain-containing protein [Roseovarius spongiae]RKF16993.1 EF-hand domain-containing protein [Roseovarius spongiae]